MFKNMREGQQSKQWTVSSVVVRTLCVLTTRCTKQWAVSSYQWAVLLFALYACWQPAELSNIAHCSLFTAHYSLLTANCSLLPAHYSLLTVNCKTGWLPLTVPLIAPPLSTLIVPLFCRVNSPIVNIPYAAYESILMRKFTAIITTDNEVTNSGLPSRTGCA